MQLAKNRTERNLNVLVIDSDSEGLTKLCDRVRQMGFDHICETDPQQGLRYAKVADVILVDWEMPGMSGLEFVINLRKRNIKAPVIIVTSNNDSKLLLEAIRAGADGFLTKPTNKWEDEHFYNAIEDKLNGQRYARLM